MAWIHTAAAGVWFSRSSTRILWIPATSPASPSTTGVSVPIPCPVGLWLSPSGNENCLILDHNWYNILDLFWEHHTNLQIHPYMTKVHLLTHTHTHTHTHTVEIICRNSRWFPHIYCNPPGMYIQLLLHIIVHTHFSTHTAEVLHTTNLLSALASCTITDNIR